MQIHEHVGACDHVFIDTDAVLCHAYPHSGIKGDEILGTALEHWVAVLRHA